MIVAKPKGKIYALLIGDLDKKFLYFLVEEKEGGGGYSNHFLHGVVLAHKKQKQRNGIGMGGGGGDEADLPFQDFMLCHVKLDVRIPPPPSFAPTKNDLHCLQYMRVHVRRWGRLK